MGSVCYLGVGKKYLREYVSFFIVYMFISDEISKQVDVFHAICKSHDVKRLFAFGSAVKETFNQESSDIDLLVEIDASDPISKGEKLISLWDALEEFFQRRVDLLTPSSIQNPFLFNSMDSSKVLIYDGTRQKVLV